MPIWRGTTSTGWNTGSNWIIDGSGNSGVPTATTDAIFDSGAVNDCVLGADRVCRDLIFTSFPNTRTVNLATFNLTSYRSVTLQSDISSRVIGTTGTLRMAQVAGGTAANGTITPNSGIWPLNFAGGSAAVTITLAADFNITGNVSINTGPTYLTNNFSIGGNFTTGGGGSFSATTTNFIMTGSGTLTMAGGACNLEINTSGTITVSGNISAGRRFVITSVGTLAGLFAVNFTFVPYNAINNVIDFGPGNRNVQDFNTNTNTNPLTILNSFTCRDISLIGGTHNGPTSPSTATITITRNYNSGNVTSTNGTLSLVMNAASGAGTILNGSIITRLPLTINAGANIVALGAAITINAGAVLTRTSGNITVGISTLSFQNGASVTINGMQFWNVSTNVNTITQNALNTINNTLTLTGNNTFTGSAGWTCANLLCSTTNATQTLANISTGASYRTTTSASLTSTAALPITMTSNNATTRSLWTLDYGAQQTLVYVNGTRIDSSQGQTVWTFGGVRTDTVNWATGSRPGTSAYTFVN
jgi:hypothetical protein